uniref:Uncharacterized protein n=1 Tax=Phytophthora ramorum TaxID=164328 RepID=H3GXI7_PHYRM
MFMSGSSFDDDAPSRGGSRGRKGGSRDDDVSDVVEVLTLDDHRTGSGGVSAHPNSLKDDDLEGEVGGAEYLSGARSNVIQQQRELQKKKLQERMGGGVVRTSLPKQYSAPRSMDVDERPSRFGRDDDELDEDPPGGRPSVRRAGSSRQSVNGRGSAGSQAHSRRSRDDDDDDDDVRRPTGSRTAGTRDWERDRERDRDYDRDYDREPVSAIVIVEAVESVDTRATKTVIESEAVVGTAIETTAMTQIVIAHGRPKARAVDPAVVRTTMTHHPRVPSAEQPAVAAATTMMATAVEDRVVEEASLAM